MVKVMSKFKYQMKSGFRHGFKNVIFSKFFFGFVASLSMIISSHDKAGRVKDNIDARFNENEDTFDFIVVGGGSAGSIVANRLSENHKVLLLEAGGEPHPLQRIPGMAFFMLNYKETDWMHRTVPQRRACFSSPNRRAGWSQGRNLGGSGNLNFMVHLRGSPRDYDYWAKITGDETWNYAGVLPYFRRHENYQGDSPDREAHGFDGELKLEIPSYTGMAKEFIRAGQELGYEHVDLNARYEEGFDTIYCPLEGGERRSSFAAFLEPIRDRETLVIRKYAHVNKILIRGFDNTAFGVEYDRHGRKRYAYATKEVILSAGTVESAKLLMLSGVGPKTHLADLGIPLVASLPVGRNLHDHLATFLGPFFIDPPRSYLIDRDITMKSFYEYKSDGNGPLSTSLFQAAAMISSKQAKHAGIWNWPDIQLLMSGMAGHKTFARDMAHAFHLNHKTLKKYYEHSLGRDSFFIAVSASRPLGRGEIVLEKKDPYAPTSINPHYLENDHDMHIMIEGIKTAMYLVENTTSFQNLRARFTSKKFPGCEHMSFRSDEYYECYVRHFSVSLNDPVGTCAMGNPHMGKDGVLDSQLQVIGVNHLRVIDASVMPAIVGSPTEAAVMMIAEKGADMILEAWRTRDQTTEGPHSSPNPHPPPHPATTYTQSGPLSANIDVAQHPGFEDGWKEFDPTKGFPTGFDDQPKGPQQSYGPPSDSVLPPVYNGPPPPGQYGPPQNNHNGGNFNNGPPPNNNYGPPKNNNNNSPPQDSYGIPQGPLSNNNNNNNNENFPLIQDSYSLPPTQKPNGPPQDTYDGPPPQKPNDFSTTEPNYNGPVQDSFDGPFKNNNFEGGYTGPPSDTYGVSVPIIQNNNGQPPWNFNGPNNNNNNNNNNEQNNYRNQNSFNGNGVSFGLSNNNNNNQFKFNENNNNNNGYTDPPQFTTSLKAPRPLSDDIDPRFNIPQDNEASTTETIANTISYQSHYTDPMEENAPRGYEHMNMESSTNTPVSYDNTTGISGYLDDSTTSETITTTNRNLAVPLSFDTYTDTSSSTKVPSKFDGEYVLDQNQNKTQDPPRNAARPDVTLLTHDTKMRPGVQISNPFPDMHYASQSQTTESSVLSPSEFRLKYPITSSVEYPNKVPNPPELGPVYFRNPEYTTRRPILIGNATADGVPVFDAPGYNETVTADARVIALSQAEDRKHYRETNRRSANKNNLKPVVVYKSAGISNKVPTAASVPDIYYTMKDQSSMDAMSNSESASPSPYWTHQMTVTLTPRPRRLDNEKGQESNQNSSPYWLNATPSSTSTPEEAITPWKPIDQSYPNFEDPPDYKAKKPAKISGLKKRPKDTDGSYSGRIVKIKSGPSWTTTMVPFSGSDSMTFFTSADSRGHGEGQNHNKIKIKIKHKNTRQDEDKGNDEIRPYFSQGSSLTSITIRRPKVKSNSKGQRGAKQVPYFPSEGFSNSNSPVTITPRPLLSVTIWPDDDMSKHYSHSSSKEAEDTFKNRKNSTKVKEDTFLSAPDFSSGQSSKEIQTDTSTYKKDGGLRSNTFITSEKPYFNEGPTKPYGLLGETDSQNSHDNNQNGKGDTDATNSPTMLISALAGAAMDEWTRSFGGNSGETYKSYQKNTDHISGNTDHYSGHNNHFFDVPSDNLKEDSRTLYHVSTTRQPQSQQINTGFTHTPTATPVFNTRVPEFFNQDSPKPFDTPPYPIDQNDPFRFQSPKDEGSENVQVPPWKPSLKLAKPEEQKSGEGFAQLIRNHYNGVDPTRFPTSFQEIPQTAAFEITTPTNEVYSSPVFDENPLRYGEATPTSNSISEEGQSSTQSTNYRNKEGGRRRRPNGQRVRGGQRNKLNGGNNNFNGQNDNLGGQNNNFNGPNDNFSGQNNNFNGQNNNFNGQNNNFNGQNNHFTDQNNFNGQIDQTRFYGQSDQFSTQNLNGQTNLIRDGKQLVNNINNPILLESATTEPIAPFNQSNDNNNNNFNFNQNANTNDQTRNQRNPSNGLTGEFSNSLNSQSQQNYVGNQNFQNQGHTIPIVNDANNFQQNINQNQNQFGNSQAGFQSFNSNQQSNVGQVPDFSGGNNNNNHNNVNNFGTNNNVGLSTPQPEQYPDFLDTFITPGTPAPFVNKHENVDLTVQSQESQQNFANNQNAHDFQQSNTQNFQQNQNNVHFQQDQFNNGQNNFNQNLNDHLTNPNSNNFGQQHSNQNIQNVPPHATNNVRHFNSQQNSNDLGNFHTNSPDFGIPNFTVSPAPNHFAQSSVSPSQQPETFQNIRNNFPQNPDNDHINSNNNFQDNRQSANPPPPIITSADYDSNNFEQTHFNPPVSNSNNNFQSSSTTDQNFNHHNTVPATATTFSETTNSNSRNFGALPPGITFQQGPGDGAFLSGTQAFDNGNFNQQQHLPKVPEFLGETEKSNTGIDTGTISLTYDDSGSSSILDQPIIKDPNDQKVHIETSANLDADHISLTHDQQQGQIFQQGQNPQNFQNDGHFQQQNHNFQQNNFQQDHTISNFQQDQNNNNFQHEIQTAPQTQVQSPHLPVDAFSNINNLEHTSVGQEQQNHDHFNGLLTNTGPPIHQSTAGTPRPLSFGSRLNGQRNRDVFADFGETIPTEPPLSFSTDFSNNGFTQQPFETFGSTAQFSSDQGLPFRGTERPFIQNQNDFSVSSQAPLQYTSNVTPSPRQREYTIFSDPDSVDITDDQFSSRFNHLKRRADILQQRRRKRRRNFLHAVRNRDAFDESEEEEDSVPFRRRPRRPHSRRRHRIENYPFAQKRSGEESPGEDKSVELSTEEDKKRSKDILEGLARLEEPIITEHQNKTKEKVVSLVPSIEKVRAALKAVPSKTKENKQPVPTHFSNVDSNINPTIPGQVIDPRSNLNVQGSQFSRKSLAIPTELNPENLLLDFSKSSAVSSGRKGKAVRSSSDRNAHVSFTVQPNNQTSHLNPQGSLFNSKTLEVSLQNQETLITNKTLQVSSKISAVRSSQSQQSETPIPNKGSLKNSESPLEPLIPNNPENLVSYKSPPKLNPNNLNFTSQGNFVRKIKVKVTTPMPVLQNAQNS